MYGYDHMAIRTQICMPFAHFQVIKKKNYIGQPVGHSS